MLHVLSRMIVQGRLPPQVECSSTLQARFFYTKPIDASSIDIKLSQAYSLEQEGKEVRAQAVYKEIIEANPKCQKAYQGLWNSWYRTCGLKVPEPELGWFMRQYKEHIDKGTQDDATPSFKP